MALEYSGYVIVPGAVQHAPLSFSGGFEIYSDNQCKVLAIKSILNAPFFNSKTEAINHGIALAQLWIDNHCGD